MSVPAPRTLPAITWLKAIAARSLVARLGAAVGLVVACTGLRLAIDPAMTPGFGYTCFYPAVILSAYWLGTRAGLLATGLSALIVFVVLAPVPFTIRTDARALIGLALFLGSSGLMIHILGAIHSGLERLKASHDRMEALVTGQADLFRDHAARVGNHLQLVAAILQLSARREDDRDVSRVLTNAASRTLLISRIQRDFAGEGDRRIAFIPFAERLVEAATTAMSGKGSSAGAVRFDGTAADLPLEQAAGLGVVLLDYLNGLAGLDRPWALNVTLTEDGEQRALILMAETFAGAEVTVDQALMEAVTEQLQGRLMITRGEAGCGVRLAFPTALQPPPTWKPLAFNLH